MRSSMGACLRIPIVQVMVAHDVVSQILKKEQLLLVENNATLTVYFAAAQNTKHTSGQSSMSYDEADYTGPFALVVGSEARGVSAEVRCAYPLIPILFSNVLLCTRCTKLFPITFPVVPSKSFSCTFRLPCKRWTPSTRPWRGRSYWPRPLVNGECKIVCPPYIDSCMGSLGNKHDMTAMSWGHRNIN